MWWKSARNPTLERAVLSNAQNGGLSCSPLPQPATQISGSSLRDDARCRESQAQGDGKVVPACWLVRLLATKKFETGSQALQISVRGDRDRQRGEGNWSVAKQPQSGDAIVMTSFR